MAFCSGCGTQIPDGSTMCPACSAKAPAAGAAQSTTGGMTDNVAGMLAYITIIPAIIFLVMEPYNKSRFIRFHSFQCIFFWVAIVVLQIVIGIFGVVPFMIFITLPLHMIVWLGSVVVWIILLLKANQGQMFKLPVIGDMAEKQANAV
ncbi:MAG: DUF4870 domain-containing protein [Acidobacteriia bacterium]|nr:DUF4870 domain-containing protein [Terriglobia bacterium]